MTTYYLIETTYVGPNRRQDQYADADYYDITIVPGRKNSNQALCTNGWLGTTNDWDHYAHGAYDTLEDARAALEELVEGRYRDVTDTLDRWEQEEAGIVLRVKPGAYEIWGAESTQDWIYNAVQEDIDANTTDAEIEALVDAYLTLGRQKAQAELDVETIHQTMHDHRTACRDCAEE